MALRRTGLDRPLLITVLLLLAFGVAMVYSAGQTDVPSSAGSLWKKQIAWAAFAVGDRSIIRILTLAKSQRREGA